MTDKNYYKTLQVDPAAEPEVISAAYKRLSLKYHPDTNPERDSIQRMQEINEAYSVLKDPARRQAYDSSLRNASGWGQYAQARSYQRERPYKEPASQKAPPSYREASKPPSAPKPKVSPMQGLANLIISITFPVVYILSTTILFRFFRAPNPIILVVLLIVAGVIAYYVTREVEKALRKK